LEQIFNKAIRDKIPEIIETAGKKYEVTTLSDPQFLSELEKKLSEEIAEYQESKNVEELADILEVIYRIVELKGLSINALEAVRMKKLTERGSFKKNLFLIKTY
jgi:predicted house-cleaning noncanonical NTP pyrophosphatase (MazG superfamily)